MLLLQEMKADISRMQALATDIASRSRGGDMVTLRGEVGAGKTTFARAFIQRIAVKPCEVTSPTFNLMQSYEVRPAGGQRQTLWHLDLYRLKHADEARELGLDELEKSIVLMEWPEIIEAQLPGSRLDIHIEYADDENIRRVKFHGNDTWRERLGALMVQA